MQVNTAASLTPRAIACAIPNLGTFLAHNGLKWSVRQIFPPLWKQPTKNQKEHPGKSISLADPIIHRTCFHI